MATKPPLKKKPRAPKSWRTRFLKALRETGLVNAAAAIANTNKSVVYRHRNEDPEFAAAWDEMLELATDDLVVEARRRGQKGTAEPVFHQGEIVGHTQKYSDNLLMFLIKKERPAYRDGRPEERTTATGERPRLTIPESDARHEPQDPR